MSIATADFDHGLSGFTGLWTTDFLTTDLQDLRLLITGLICLKENQRSEKIIQNLLIKSDLRNRLTVQSCKSVVKILVILKIIVIRGKKCYNIKIKLTKTYMKELFNKLSNVSNFFNEKRFVYQYETPKAPEAPKSPSETRVEQAKFQDKYLQPQENIVSEEGHKLEPRAGVKYKLMRVRENVGKIPSCDQLFGVEVPVFTINDKTYALRDKNGKYYDAATKKPIDLQPKDNLEFPTNPESYQRMKLLASIAEGKAVKGPKLPPMDLGPEPKPEERVDEGAIAAQRREDLRKAAQRMPGVPPSKPEPPVREAVAARPKIRKVREALTIEFNDRNTRVANEQDIKDTKNNPYVVIYSYRTEQVNPNEKREIPVETVAVRNTPQGFMDANGNWVTPEGEYRILIPLDNAEGRTIANYLEAKATGAAEAKPEAPTMLAGGKMRRGVKPDYADARPGIRAERAKRRGPRP